MEHSLYDLLDGYGTVTIIGMCKNAGKTTALNRLIAEAGAHPVTLALTSIGRDGEDTDLVTGTAKPGIWVQEGTLVATAAGLLGVCDITREILATTGITTPMGEVIVLRALSDGYIQIAGPSTVGQLAQLKPVLRQFGADKLFIDGALSRKSLCSRRLSEATVLCTGASCGRSMAGVVAETAFFCQLALLPEASDPRLLAAAENPGGAKAVLVGDETIPLDSLSDLAGSLRSHKENQNRYLFFDGALTDVALKPLATSGLDLSGLCLVVRDASKILAGQANVEKLAARRGSLAVLESVNLAAVTVNPFSAYGTHFDKDEFAQAMANAVPVPVMNVEEMPEREEGGAPEWN